MTRLLVAGVGNVLRCDDGFGPVVVERLGAMPAEVEAVETGIGGVALLQELLAGCDGVIVVDAVERGAPPGTVFVETPDVRTAPHIADVHLADPQRVLSMAKSMRCLPSRVVIVGCQPADMDDLGAGLSPAVERAVPVAVAKIRRIVDAWVEELAGARV
jgi:hydrogenase maturation protease